MNWSQLTEQDTEDHHQELLIKNWLSQHGAAEFHFTNTTKGGRPKASFVKASISLDQKITKDSDTTFSEFIAFQPQEDRPSNEEIFQQMDSYLSCLGFNERDSTWLIKILKLSNQEKFNRSKKSVMNLPW